MQLIIQDQRLSFPLSAIKEGGTFIWRFNTADDYQLFIKTGLNKALNLETGWMALFEEPEKHNFIPVTIDRIAVTIGGTL